VRRDPGSLSATTGLAWLYIEQGRAEKTRPILERFAADGLETLALDYDPLPLFARLAVAVAPPGDPEPAAALAAPLEPSRGALVLVGPALVFGGAVTHFLGLLAACRELWEDAAACFEDAIATHARMGARPWEARTRLAYAGALLTPGRNEDRTRA